MAEIGDVSRFVTARPGDPDEVADVRMFDDFSVSMTNYEIVEVAKGKKQVIYLIEVRQKGKPLWTIRRTYGEFKWLDEKVRPRFKNLPKLPGEKLIGKTDPSFLEKRKILLRKYLQSCVKPTFLAKLLCLRSWLESDSKGRHAAPHTESGINQRAVAVVRAQVGYHGQGADRLSFDENEMISVIEKTDDGMWKGKSNNRVGFFPVAAVELIADLPGQTHVSTMEMLKGKAPAPASSSAFGQSEEIVRALFPYDAEKETDLPLEEGDIVTILSKDDDPWWEGQKEDGQRGHFPSNYVEPYTGSASFLSVTTAPESSAGPGAGAGVAAVTAQLEASLSVAGTPMSTSTEDISAQKTCTALYDFEAQETQDLAFRQGDVITIVDDSNENWWQGSLNGQTGQFPAGYVELIPPVEAVEQVSPQPDYESTAAATHQAQSASVAYSQPPPISTAAEHGDAGAMGYGGGGYPQQEYGDPYAQQQPQQYAYPQDGGYQPEGQGGGGYGMPPQQQYMDPSQGQGQPQPAAEAEGQPAKVLYNFVAESEQEMTLQAGQTIMVLGENGGWFFGRNDMGECGHFPPQYVQML